MSQLLIQIIKCDDGKLEYCVNQIGALLDNVIPISNRMMLADECVDNRPEGSPEPFADAMSRLELMTHTIDCKVTMNVSRLEFLGTVPPS